MLRFRVTTRPITETMTIRASPPSYPFQFLHDRNRLSNATQNIATSANNEGQFVVVERAPSFPEPMESELTRYVPMELITGVATPNEMTTEVFGIETYEDDDAPIIGDAVVSHTEYITENPRQYDSDSTFIGIEDDTEETGGDDDEDDSTYEEDGSATDFESSSG